MGRYISRRLLQMIPLMIGISLIIFLIIQAAPGGPEGMLLETGRFIDPSVIEAYRHRLGVDQPVYIQYFRWISAAISGDFGISFQTTRPVTEMIVERLPATLELMTISFIFAALIAIPMGVYSALHQYSAFDLIGTTTSFLGIAMPVFWFRLILQLIFSVKFGWLPVSGTETVGVDTFGTILNANFAKYCIVSELYCRVVTLHALQHVGSDTLRLYPNCTSKRDERIKGGLNSCHEERAYSGGIHNGIEYCKSFFRSSYY